MAQMKYLYYLLFLCSLYYCEKNFSGYDAVPPNAIIIDPINNTTVSGVIDIVCKVSDNDEVVYALLIIDNQEIDTYKAYDCKCCQAYDQGRACHVWIFWNCSAASAKGGSFRLKIQAAFKIKIFV